MTPLPTGSTPEELHIASLVVHATPARLATVADAVSGLPGACIHGSSPAGKLVVTLEASSAGELTQRVVDIQRIDGVFSAALVFQCADSLETMNEELPNAQA